MEPGPVSKLGLEPPTPRSILIDACGCRPSTSGGQVPPPSAVPLVRTPSRRVGPAGDKEKQINNMARKAIPSGQIAEESMQYRFRKVTRTVKKWAAVLAAIATAVTANISAGRADEAQAKSLLKAMSDYLAAEKAISFDYDSNLEIVSTQQQKNWAGQFRHSDPQSP